LVTEVFPYEFCKKAPAGVTLTLTTLMVARHKGNSELRVNVVQGSQAILCGRFAASASTTKSRVTAAAQ